VAGTLPGTLRLGQSVTLDRDAAVAALRKIAEPLGLTAVQAARAVLDVVNTNMALAARQATVAQGIDPRDHTMVAFGGAGPLHAVDLARELGIGKVLIPATPGTMCALGLLVSDLETEYARTRLTALEDAALPTLNAIWAELDARARSWTERQGRTGAVRLIHRADLRYRGQDHSLTITVPAAPWTKTELDDVLTAFRTEHQERNGYAAEDEAIEIENFRVVPRIQVNTGAMDPAPTADDVVAREAEPRTIPVWWTTAAETPTPVLHRDRLTAGARVDGPALVVQEDTTLLIPPAAAVEAGPDGSLICIPWTTDPVPPAIP